MEKKCLYKDNKKNNNDNYSLHDKNEFLVDLTYNKRKTATPNNEYDLVSNSSISFIFDEKQQELECNKNENSNQKNEKSYESYTKKIFKKDECKQVIFLKVLNVSEFFENLQVNEKKAFEFFCKNLIPFGFIEPKISIDNFSNIYDINYDPIFLDLESVFSLNAHFVALNKKFDLIEFSKPIIFTSNTESLNNISNETNKILESGIYRFTKFNKLSKIITYLEVDLREDNLEEIKNMFFDIMSIKRKGVNFLFPQNEYLKQYYDNLNKKPKFLENQSVIFEYLYFLHLFDILLDLDFEKLYKDIGDFQNVYSRFPNDLTIVNHEKTNLKFKNIHRKKMFFYILKSELQRIYCYLISPFLIQKDYYAYVLLSTYERFSFYKFSQVSKSQLPNITSFFPENKTPLILMQTFYAIKLIENGLKQKKLIFFARDESFFDEHSFIFFKNRSNYVKKMESKLRIQKMYSIFLIYFFDKDLSIETEIVRNKIKCWIENVNYLEENHLKKFLDVNKYARIVNNKILNMLKYRVQEAFEILSYIQYEKYNLN